MSTYKTTSNDYIINLGPYDSGNTAWLGTLTVNGNLNVEGNITSVSDIKVDDAFIIVAGNNTGTVTSMGLIAQKTATTWAGLRFNSLTSEWEISPSVTEQGVDISPYAPIATGNASVAGSNTQIQFNDSGTFGANVNLTYDFANSKITLQGHQVFGNTATPANVANSVAVYSNVVGAGGTGLYFTSSAANDELVSKSKAIVFSIIF